MIPVLLKDGYKVGHKFQYPADLTKVYSNLTPRSSRLPGVSNVVVFGFQAFVLKYLIDKFNREFFFRPKATVMAEYKRRIDNYLGPGMDLSHIAALYDLQYLPIEVKALPEGTMCPLRVPMMTITNTDPRFGWLPNMLETLLSNVLWQGMTSATIALEYRKNFERWADVTGADRSFIPWQGHDFSMRGMSGIEACQMSGAGHLLSFTGTDTIPAIDFLEEYYGANCERELIGGSVAATEHSVMCMGMQDGELGTIRRLITETYPKDIVSIVSDTWDFWRVLIEYLPMLRSEILSRNGKVVIRPDSGDPVKIICGDPNEKDDAVIRGGAIQCLWNLFGGTINEKGFKVLDSHIGLIYGDSITLERQEQILSGLAAKGFASSNVVLGIGSYTFQYVTRDTFGFAMKATWGCTESGGPQDIFKDPQTDDGTKKSAKGLLSVHEENGTLVVRECQTPEQEAGGFLQTIFKNGRQYNFQTLGQIRERLAKNFRS